MKKILFLLIGVILISGCYTTFYPPDSIMNNIPDSANVIILKPNVTEYNTYNNDYYDDYSSENVFLLTFKNTLGSRMAVENGGLQVTNEDDFVIPISFQQTIHFEDQKCS